MAPTPLKIANLIAEIEKLKKTIGIAASIQEAGVAQEAFYAQLDEMSELAFDDQCTGANPRYPLISELKGLYIDAFGPVRLVKGVDKNEAEHTA